MSIDKINKVEYNIKRWWAESLPSPGIARSCGAPQSSTKSWLNQGSSPQEEKTNGFSLK